VSAVLIAAAAVVCAAAAVVVYLMVEAVVDGVCGRMGVGCDRGGQREKQS
jgi:hypothetical protein